MNEPPVEPTDCIHHLFEATAARSPEALALCCGARRLTYAQLNAHANRLARHLRELGVGPERLAGVLLERSPEALIATLAILKAGGAFLPLDPAIPQDRLATLLGESAPVLVVTRGELAARLPPECRAVCVDREAALVARQPDTNPPPAALPDNFAYAIFTSGSTGVPKGVLVAHRGLCNLAREYVRLFEISPGDRVLQFASLGFDASVEEIFKAWAGGAALHLPEPAAQVPGPELVQLLRDEAITLATLPPSALAALPSADLPALRAVVSAGERCPADLVERWSGGRAFFNAYGPTEATVCATVARCHDPSRPPPIGRPLRGVEVLVLDDHLEPAPAGVTGELFIGGVGLARGYLGRPGATAERFIPHPRPREPGERLYRTGDRARVLADGALEFVGRDDRQVKIRGHRVELEEIEATLEKCPAVREAAAVARRDDAGEVRLVAYVGLQPGGEAELRSFLKAALPGYMLPSALVVLDALPRTPHGKVDRRRLPWADGRRPRPPDLPAAQAPRTPLEQTLVALWESLLGVAPLGVADDFFELGGHSLLATRMMAQLQLEHGRRLSFPVLLQQPTIEAVAKALESPSPPLRSPVVPLRSARGSTLPLFCVHPVGGSVACYVELARALGPDQTFLGLQSPGLDGTPYPFTTLEEIAAHYLEAMRRHQPSGPYALAGWSNGGVLAFEMAQQLLRRGEQVALLALIDSRAPTPATRQALMKLLGGALDDAAMGYLFLLHLARLAQQRPTARLDVLRALPAAQLHAHLLEEADRFGTLPPGATEAILRPILDVYRTNFRSVVEYEPRPYAGPLTLFRAAEDVPEPPHPPPWGWDGYAAGPFEVHDVPGNHYTVVSKAHSPALALKLRRVLEERRP